MIISCIGSISIRGNRDDVYAEFGCICGSMLKAGFSKEELLKAIILADMLNREERIKNEKSNN